MLCDEVIVSRRKFFGEPGIGNERIVRFTVDRDGYDGEDVVAEYPELDAGRISFRIAGDREWLTSHDRRGGDRCSDEGFFEDDLDIVRTCSPDIVCCLWLACCIYRVRPGSEIETVRIQDIFPGLVGLCCSLRECAGVSADDILARRGKFSAVFRDAGTGYEEVRGIRIRVKAMKDHAFSQVIGTGAICNYRDARFGRYGSCRQYGCT